jgi:hypothetical protein
LKGELNTLACYRVETSHYSDDDYFGDDIASQHFPRVKLVLVFSDGIAFDVQHLRLEDPINALEVRLVVLEAYPVLLANCFDDPLCFFEFPRVEEVNRIFLKYVEGANRAQ